MNPWKILGVHRQSTPEEVKAAFYKLAWKTHPDQGGKEDFFQEISQAYQLLSDKKLASDFIRAMLVRYAQCVACKGDGAKFKSVGLTAKTFSTCHKCGGAGVMIITLEEKKNAIILQSTGPVSGRRSNNKRKT